MKEYVRLITILVKSIKENECLVKVYDLQSLIDRVSVEIGKTSNINEADLVLVDVVDLETKLLSEIKRLPKHSLIVVFNVFEELPIWSKIANILAEYGLLYSYLHIGNGIALISWRGYDKRFFEKTVEIYNLSVSKGPMPIHYNTAKTLYIITRFITRYRDGVVVEVGTGRGFSTLWLAKAVSENGKMLISIDNKCDRVEEARKALSELGLSNVKAVCGDARKYHVDDNIVSLFIDGAKEEYHIYLENFEKNLVKYSLVAAHNTLLPHPHKVKEYIEKVYGREYESITIATDPSGLTLSLYLGRK